MACGRLHRKSAVAVTYKVAVTLWAPYETRNGTLVGLPFRSDWPLGRFLGSENGPVGHLDGFWEAKMGPNTFEDTGGRLRYASVLSVLCGECHGMSNEVLMTFFCAVS